ncbi:MAG: radical SAM protein [Nanoarchaeota archaeon]
MRKPTNTKFYSKLLGELPKGCQMCVKGEKLVLYITGICPRKCWYCPLSEKRKNKDVIFVNEWQTNSQKDLIQEVKLCQSKGAGITGGDPLSKLDRTTQYIKLLKKEFGKKFHIHLYTSFELVTKENLQKLYDSGLDEIRFHPNLSDKKLWNKINIANEFKWDVGVEIPCIPKLEKETFELTDFLEGKIKFLNLNEFEISDLNSEEMTAQGYEMTSDISHAISGSLELGEKILKYCGNKSFSVHFCSSKLKDKVQMQNRFKLRAESIKTKFDIITEEGLLLRGIIELREKRLESRDLNYWAEFLEEEGLEIFIDENKNRLITYPEHVEQFADILKDLGLIPSIIEEDPTVEAFIVNRDYL